MSTGSSLFLAAMATICQLSCRPEQKKPFLAHLCHANISLAVILNQDRQASRERPCVPLGTLWTSLVAGSIPCLSHPVPHSSGELSSKWVLTGPRHAKHQQAQLCSRDSQFIHEGRGCKQPLLQWKMCMQQITVTACTAERACANHRE